MLKKLHLKNFKNFEDAQLTLGNFTILVGTNASGKSNLRDAFRFLHGIARGYNLAEIIGEKWIEGGVLQWRGIRGGTKEVTFQGKPNFSLEIEFILLWEKQEREATYKIEVAVDIATNNPPKVIAEKLYISGKGEYIFDSHPKRKPIIQENNQYLKIRIKNSKKGRNPEIEFSNQTPIISQIIEHHKDKVDKDIRRMIHLARNSFTSMRFLDFNTEAMRSPSIPGQNILGDQGENLSSVLYNICEDINLKEAVIEWIEELTPMEAVNLDFPADQTGKILLTLIEKNGQRISAYSASDGTLRFLAIIAALLGSQPARFYFFEELENGIHPTRLNLLLQLIESQVNRGKIQIVATTHSSYLLTLLSEKTLEFASLTYRLENRDDAQIIRILDIPYAKESLKKENLGRLHESAWLEDVMEFLTKDN